MEQIDLADAETCRKWCELWIKKAQATINRYEAKGMMTIRQRERYYRAKRDVVIYSSFLEHLKG